MILTPRLHHAIKLASHLHRFQTRKDVNLTPYISHLISVSIIVSSITDDEDIIIAGLMHDSLEDVPNYTFDMLVRDCGIRVAEIVKHVTEPLDGNKSKDDQFPWLQRKEAYLHVLKTGGIESALVSAADKIHNTQSFLQDIQEDKETFLKRFKSSTKNKIWFNEQVLLILEEKLDKDHTLVKQLKECTEQFKNLLNENEK